MLLKYFYDEALAHASYLVGCQRTGEAFVIDPARTITPYLEAAAAEKLTITGCVETHIHADYVSGSCELAKQTEATIYLSDDGPADWKYEFGPEYSVQRLKEGDRIAIGKIQLTTMHTPGHTPESISLLLTDFGSGANEPMGIFTGDFIFVGAVGRPDLLEEAAGISGSADQGARELFRSIEKFNSLPDYLQVWPAHGAGSACGKGLGAIPSSTVGYEKRFNPALQFTNKEGFVRFILDDQPEAPPYFGLMKKLNKLGPKIIGDFRPKKLTPQQLDSLDQDCNVIDTAEFEQFASQHVPGTINLPIKYLASQGGWLINYEAPTYLVSSEKNILDAVQILREIGIDNIEGYFDAEEVYASGLASEKSQQQSPQWLAGALSTNSIRLVDVRRKSEWNAGRIAGAEHIFLGRLAEEFGQTRSQEDHRSIVLQCRTGSRSAIATSVLRSLGVKNVINLSGGIEQWETAGCPIVKESPSLKSAPPQEPVSISCALN
ncbi:MBL fold metallo-hydrolase [Mariniblastus sp.]|nr:MBL fold metallo-hydrolase [Mariniblastus sp.]